MVSFKVFLKPFYFLKKTGYNSVGVQYEPFQNGGQYAYKRESYLSEKLYVGNLTSGSTEVWWDFDNNYADLTVYQIKELAWNNTNSIYAIIEASLAKNSFEVYRVDKYGGNFQAVPVISSNKVPMTAITVSPDKQFLYITLKTTKGEKMNLVQLDQNGNFANAYEMGFGGDPNWRLVNPVSRGRSKATTINESTIVTTSAIHELLKEANQTDHFLNKGEKAMPIINGKGIVPAMK